MIKSSFIIVLFFIIHIKSQSPDCNCDLKPNECDINCCCDTKCTQWDLNSFNCPSNQIINNIDKKWCIPDSALYISNAQFKTRKIDDYFCVYQDDSLVRNYYKAPLPDDGRLSSTSVGILVNLVSNSAIDLSNQYQTLNSQKTSFDSSDYVWIIYKDDNLGYLNFPQQNVQNSIPVRYLQNKANFYSASSDAINSECSATTAQSSLSLAYFIDNFKIIKAPNSLSECYKKTSQDSTTSKLTYYEKCSNQTYTTQMKIRKCIGSDGNIINKCSEQKDLLKPSILNGKCSNLVKSVIIVFNYRNQEGIIDTAIDVTFAENISPSTNSIEQNFQVYFTESALGNFDYNSKLNPGYDEGEFIKVGETESTFSSNSLSYLKADKDGSCLNDNREFVKFQYNIESGCILKKTADLNDIDKFCLDLQDEIDSIILGKTSAFYFSQYSDKTKSNPKKIINSDRTVLSKPTANSDSLGGICKNVRYGVVIRVAFALNGNIYGPVSTVEYISYKWNKIKDVNLRCSDQLCINTNNEIQIKISTRVEFIDVSQSPLYYETSKKRAVRTKPGDFFFALTGNANRHLYHKMYLFGLLAIVILML